MTASLASRLAAELAVGEGQVRATLDLLRGGATVPFIARYRKEATGGLDDVQLRTLDERARYLTELDERRAAIVESIAGQGKLTDGLRAALEQADTKARLEDLYAPFKPRRRTKAQIARENGLEPLAEALLADPDLVPDEAAAAYLSETVADVAAALEGARAILIERFGDDADLIGELREQLWRTGRMTAEVRDGKEESGAKYADYFHFAQALDTLPSHRIMALLRGEKDDVLSLAIDAEPGVEREVGEPTAYEAAIAARFGIGQHGRAGDRWLVDTVRRAWRGRISLGLEVDLRLRLREHAERAAIEVFAANLRALLLAAPAGGRPTLGLDPGYRTGVKVAVVDATGRVVDTGVIYPHQPQNRWREALAQLSGLVAKHGVELVAIGNGTASRETDRLAGELAAAHPGLTPVVVSEAGASVYSASAFAAAELPELDVTLRGAVSIARRLQDPLAELVKIEPRSIGVGQYQHDLPERELTRALDAVVEDCVNAVGVDVNTASVPLLTRVSGVGPALAEAIVAHRDTHGPLASRRALKDVPRLGAKAFEQAAGFLRIQGGSDPLDASAVHPESYPLVHRMAQSAGVEVPQLIGNTAVLRGLNPRDFVTDEVGLPTVTDTLAELDKPGRDPRPSFVTAKFAEGVHELTDLTPGMVLEGQVTNVAAFGAFVDVGVHQDGLVHISALADRFVRDPREVVSPGDVVKVKVLDVDVPRKRISLTMRLADDVPAASGASSGAGSSGTASSGVGSSGTERRGSRSPRAGGGRPDRERGESGGSGRGGAARRGTDRQGGTPPTGAMADALRRAGIVR